MRKYVNVQFTSAHALRVSLILRWHRRNMNGSCYARFLPRKLPKTVLLRTAARDFMSNLRVTHKNLFPIRAGAPQQRCATLNSVSKKNSPLLPPYAVTTCRFYFKFVMVAHKIIHSLSPPPPSTHSPTLFIKIQ